MYFLGNNRPRTVERGKETEGVKGSMGRETDEVEKVGGGAGTEWEGKVRCKIV